MLYTLGNILINLNKFIKYAKKYIPVIKLLGLKQDKETLKLIVEFHIKYPKLVMNLNISKREKVQLIRFFKNLGNNKKNFNIYVDNLWHTNKTNILKNNYTKIHKVIV